MYSPCSLVPFLPGVTFEKSIDLFLFLLASERGATRYLSRGAEFSRNQVAKDSSVGSEGATANIA